ncbi:MAG: hypothetical protein KKB30_17070, partial [Proteobacteria bacterium]|nr:hypothetical protein [Pseudomonadota bacterium]
MRRCRRRTRSAQLRRPIEKWLRRPDLLPHEDRVADPEADEGDRNQGYQEGRHDHDALQQRERVLEAR